MKQRLELVDSIRGMAIISMIFYHACWIMCFFGILITNDMMSSNAFIIWQKSICITFITISGFSFSLGNRKLRNGLMVLGIGVAITVLSLLFLYELRDIFGILWLIGICTLIMIPLDKYICSFLINKKKITIILMILSVVLYITTRNMNYGYINIFGNIFNLPKGLYRNIITTLIGFMMPTFYSVDYFSIFPWCFLYFAGYCFHKIIKDSDFERGFLAKGIPFLKYIGKHSLKIYVIHPVVIYIMCIIVTMVRR